VIIAAASSIGKARIGPVYVATGELGGGDGGGGGLDYGSGKRGTG